MNPPPWITPTAAPYPHCRVARCSGLVGGHRRLPGLPGGRGGHRDAARGPPRSAAGTRWASQRTLDARHPFRQDVYVGAHVGTERHNQQRCAAGSDSGCLHAPPAGVVALTCRPRSRRRSCRRGVAVRAAWHRRHLSSRGLRPRAAAGYATRAAVRRRPPGDHPARHRRHNRHPYRRVSRQPAMFASRASWIGRQSTVLNSRCSGALKRFLIERELRVPGSRRAVGERENERGTAPGGCRSAAGASG